MRCVMYDITVIDVFMNRRYYYEHLLFSSSSSSLVSSFQRTKLTGCWLVVFVSVGKRRLCNMRSLNTSDGAVLVLCVCVCGEHTINVEANRSGSVINKTWSYKCTETLSWDWSCARFSSIGFPVVVLLLTILWVLFLFTGLGLNGVFCLFPSPPPPPFTCTHFTQFLLLLLSVVVFVLKKKEKKERKDKKRDYFVIFV